MTGPQRIEPEDPARDRADDTALPAFDLDIPPLRPVSHTTPAFGTPNFGPLPRARYKTVESEPDASPTGRALDALAALLATPLGQPLPTTPVAAPLARTVVPDVMTVADAQAAEPDVGFASTAVMVASARAVPTVRDKMAVQRAAFEIVGALPDLLPQLQTPPARSQPNAALDLPWGDVSYRLFVM